MPSTVPTAVTMAVLAALAFAGAGCTAQRGGYPDDTAETRNRADAIRADAAQRKAAVSREHDEKVAAERFRATQIRERARQDREASGLARDQEVQPLLADQREQRVRAEREQQAIEDAAAIELRTADGAAADRIRADAAAKRAERARQAATDASELSKRIDAAELKARDRRAQIDDREVKDLADVDRAIAELDRVERQRLLDIDRETAAALDKLGEDSARRVSAQRTDENNRLEADRRISQAARERLDQDRGRNGEVTVTVLDGVVTLGGSVANELDRRAAIERIAGIDGVLRVEDRMRVR